MTQVKLFGSKACRKSRFYEKALSQRNVSYVFLDVIADDTAEQEARSLFADGQLKFPTLLVGDKVIRNPALRDLDRVLARENILDLGVVHEPDSQRFVQYMKPRDAFVSYSLKDSRVTLTHIEVPQERQGSGLGARLALATFPKVQEMGLPAHITCSFMRRVAASDPKWAQFFGISH